MLTIVDDLVSVDSLIEERLTEEPLNEYIQSCDIVAFNKICKFYVQFRTCSCIDLLIAFWEITWLSYAYPCFLLQD